jgi:hypothetical protein
MKAIMTTGWQMWNDLSSLWALWCAVAWVAFRAVAQTEWYEERRLRRDAAAIFYKYRALFVETERSYSIPAFVQSTEAMTLREWAYHAMTPPGLLFNRDWMEYITLINRARQLIEATFKAPDSARRMDAYQQLEPRFNQLCQELNTLREGYKLVRPVQFHQRYLPHAPREIESPGRTR